MIQFNSMKTLTFKSTKGGKFNITLPKNYKKIKLPLFKKWVSALESGKYRQCTGTLCSTNNKKLTYCCLGVLSKIQGRLNKANVAFEDGFDTNETANLAVTNPLYKILHSVGAFPVKVHVNNEDNDYDASSLIDCNDELKLSFKDIAKIIKTLYKA